MWAAIPAPNAYPPKGWSTGHKAMQLKLWQTGNNGRAIDIKVENGQAYGRLRETNDWTELDDPSQVFAPGGDPLGFLVAAENVQEVGSKEYEVGGSNPTPYSLLPLFFRPQRRSLRRVHPRAARSGSAAAGLFCLGTGE